MFFWAPVMKWVSTRCQLVSGCQAQGNLQQHTEQARDSQQILEVAERLEALILNIWGGTKLALITTQNEGDTAWGKCFVEELYFSLGFTKGFSCEIPPVAQGRHDAKLIKHVSLLRVTNLRSILYG